MDQLRLFLTTTPLWAAIAGWAVCQLYKGFSSGIRRHDWSVHAFLTAGGMPSSHTATVVSLSTFVGMKEGLASTYFAICAVFTLVVMFDAMGVRRETGRQGKVLNSLVDIVFQGRENLTGKSLKEIVGHSPLEVLCGAAVGIATGLVMYAVMAGGGMRPSGCA